MTQDFIDGYDAACDDIRNKRKPRTGTRGRTQDWIAGYHDAWHVMASWESNAKRLGEKFRAGYLWPFSSRMKPK